MNQSINHNINKSKMFYSLVHSRDHRDFSECVLACTHSDFLNLGQAFKLEQFMSPDTLEQSISLDICHLLVFEGKFRILTQCFYERLHTYLIVAS